MMNLKTVTLAILALTQAACNAPESGGGSVAELLAGVANQEDTYTMRLTGNGVQFTLSMLMDINEDNEEQLVVGPLFIANGEMKEFTVTGYVVYSIGVTRMNNVPAALQLQLLKNGVLEDVVTLSSAGQDYSY